MADLMSPSPVTVDEGALVQDVLATMSLRRIRHILIVDARQRLVGLATYRDLTRPTPGAGQRLEPTYHGLPIGQVMCRQVATVDASCCSGEAARYMFRTKRGCLPVVDDAGRPVGILTEADFLREFMRAGTGCGCSVEEQELSGPERVPA